MAMPNLPSDPHEFIVVCQKQFELLAHLAMGQNIFVGGKHVSKAKAIAHEATAAAQACKLFVANNKGEFH